MDNKLNNDAENLAKPLLCTERVSKKGNGLDTKIKWKAVKIWKPNLIQKLLIKLRIIKDPRYNGEKKNMYLSDEAGMWQDPNRNLNDYWGAVK